MLQFANFPGGHRAVVTIKAMMNNRTARPTPFPAGPSRGDSTLFVFYCWSLPLVPLCQALPAIKYPVQKLISANRAYIAAANPTEVRHLQI